MAKRPSRIAQRDANAAKLESAGIVAICDMLREGRGYREVAERVGVSLSSLWRWLHADEERALAVRSALQDSADTWDQEAEEVLKSISATATKAEVAQARELAQHYRWRASKRNPRVFGEKQQVELDASVGIALTEEQVNARLLAIFAKAGKAPAD